MSILFFLGPNAAEIFATAGYKMEESSEDSRAGDVTVEEEKKESAPQEASALLSTSLLECPICLQLLGEPVTTPCGHTFCRFCLVFALRKTKKKCPACRRGLLLSIIVSLNLLFAAGRYAIYRLRCMQKT